MPRTNVPRKSRITLRIPPPMLAQLLGLAHVDGTTLNAICELAMRAYARQRRGDLPGATRAKPGDTHGEAGEAEPGGTPPTPSIRAGEDEVGGSTHPPDGALS